MLLRHYNTFFWLLLFGIVILFARWHTFDEPLERDLTAYAVIAHELLNGRDLYSDLWDHKPPAIHVTYLLGELVAGYGESAIYVLNVTASLLTMLGIYLAGYYATGARRAGLWAAATWAIISGTLPLQANQPNVEVFMNACIIWVLALSLRPGALTYWRALAIGSLFFLASLYKTIAIAVAVLFSLGYFFMIYKHFQPSEEGNSQFGFPPPHNHIKYMVLFYLKRVLLMGMVGIIGWLLVFAYFYWRGHFTDFYEAVFFYNSAYAGDMLTNLSKGLTWQYLFPSALQHILPLFLLNLVGIVLGLRHLPHHWFWWLLYAVAVIIMIALPGKFYLHYYQFWLPLLAVGSGWAIHEIGVRLEQQWLHRWPTVTLLGGAIIAILLKLEYPYYRLSPEEWSALKYSPVFINSRAFGKELGRVLPPEATFYQISAEPGLYFYSQRRPPAGVIYHYPFFMAPLPLREKLLNRTLQALAKQPPLLIIAELAEPEKYPNYPLARWFSQHYQWGKSIAGQWHVFEKVK